MRLFDTPGADAAYDRWQNPPDVREHTDYGCSNCLNPDEDGHCDPGCDNCHEFDIEMALSKECSLCVTLFENQVAEGERCLKHPRRYCEPGYCEGCEDEKQQGGQHAANP